MQTFLSGLHAVALFLMFLIIPWFILMHGFIMHHKKVSIVKERLIFLLAPKANPITAPVEKPLNQLALEEKWVEPFNCCSYCLLIAKLHSGEICRTVRVYLRHARKQTMSGSFNLPSEIKSKENKAHSNDIITRTKQNKKIARCRF